MASSKTAGLHWYVQFDIERSTSYWDLVHRIAEGWCTVDYVPAWLKDAVAAERGVCSGQASVQLELIGEQLGLVPTYKNDGARVSLRMESISSAKSAAKAAKLLSPFQVEAGALMAGATRDGLRLAVGEYERIARKLDAEGLKLLSNLEPSYRRELATWNQKHGKTGKAVHTWEKALASDSLRRGATKTLNRAEEVYRSSLAFGVAWTREEK
ncbi:MAG: hypothetical protein WBQ94_14425 [Terracidiphilus sp.]